MHLLCVSSVFSVSITYTQCIGKRLTVEFVVASAYILYKVLKLDNSVC